MKIIDKIGHFKLIRDSRDFVVINELGDYAAHAHFKSETGARDCIRLINKGLLPRNEYYRKACKRLLFEDEYNRLIERSKEKYINVNKGVRR